MEILAVQRVIEEHAARRGEIPAILQAGRTLSYRELNHAANTVARALADRGMKRGGHAIVTLPESCELVILLLAILKLGGSYAWLPPLASTSVRDTHTVANPQWRVAIAPRHDAHREACVPVEIEDLLRRPVRPSPNLPVLTRASDIACVLRTHARPVLVPHGTLLSLRSDGSDGPHDWVGDATTFGLWSALLGGATLRVRTATPLPHAA